MKSLYAFKHPNGSEEVRMTEEAERAIGHAIINGPQVRLLWLTNRKVKVSIGNETDDN